MGLSPLKSYSISISISISISRVARPHYLRPPARQHRPCHPFRRSPPARTARRPCPSASRPRPLPCTTGPRRRSAKTTTGKASGRTSHPCNCHPYTFRFRHPRHGFSARKTRKRMVTGLRVLTWPLPGKRDWGRRPGTILFRCNIQDSLPWSMRLRIIREEGRVPVFFNPWNIFQVGE